MESTQARRRQDNAAAPPGNGLGMWPAWLVLLISLVATAAIWQWTAARIEEQMRTDFQARVADIRGSLESRLAGYSLVLRGAAALFSASEEVTREDWHEYVAGLQLPSEYPAIQAVAFARYVPAGGLDSLVRQVRASGVADFTVWPEGRREHYVVNVFTEPYSGLNVKALGYDMWQDGIRRQAMEQALQSGRATITRKITLKVDEGAPVPAFIMYLPVFDRSRTTLHGFVLSPFRMPDVAGVALAIHDGVEMTEAALLYRGPREKADHTPRFSASERMPVAGREWVLSFASEPSLEKAAAANRPLQVLAIGIVISLLLFAVMWSVVSMRRRAVLLAERMTRSLSESERKYRLITENASDVIWLLDVDTQRFLYVSPSVERLRGFTPEEVMSQPMLEALTPQSRELLQRILPENIAEFQRGVRKTYINEVEQPRKDGSAVWTETSTRFERDPTSGHLVVYGVSRDITERKVAERRLRDFNAELERRVHQRTAELERANRDLESFSYSISHDLRAPLRAINGFSSILASEERERLSADGKDLLDRVAKAATRLGQLIDDVLEYSRAGRLAKADERVDLRVLAQKISGELEETYPHTAITVGGLPTVQGDPTMLRQILINLVGNACKYSSRRAQPMVEIGAQEGQDEVVIHVQDNGAGFDMRYADKLFGMFQRLHPESDFQGTGVGLAIVKRLVERHGGRVWAEAEPDRGATFRFTLGKGRV
ncbi:MAG: CHASE domain-containing protein [Denitratisoma sp.]|nr:CHASE domain-containing protein [Denitratisoma sp.]